MLKFSLDTFRELIRITGKGFAISTVFGLFIILFLNYATEPNLSMSEHFWALLLFVGGPFALPGYTNHYAIYTVALFLVLFAAGGIGVVVKPGRTTRSLYAILLVIWFLMGYAAMTGFLESILLPESIQS